MTDLARALGSTPPPEFDALADQDRRALAELVERAALTRSQRLDSAIDDSLGHIPALLRKPVKRTLGL